MQSTDVIVAGGGISGLLIAFALAPQCSVTLLEQHDDFPQNKYWLTDEKAVSMNPDLAPNVDRCYEFLNFVAYDGLTARVSGNYCLWDTKKLVEQLKYELSANHVRILTGHRLYSITHHRNEIVVRANTETINAKLLIDCMGFGSPLVGAKNIASVSGYYIVYGAEVKILKDTQPIALDNVIIDRHPAYFELFPTSNGTAQAGIIFPSNHYTSSRSIKRDFQFILKKSHYSENIAWNEKPQKSYFGIIPVGRLRHPVLDRIVFFGEAGQANPAASATGLSRMLRTYRSLANSLVGRIESNQLARKQLLSAVPPYMTRMNRVFQEVLFESLLDFDSDDFHNLVRDLNFYPDNVINDLIFAEFDFNNRHAMRLGMDALLHPKSVLGLHILKAIARFLSWNRSV